MLRSVIAKWTMIMLFIGANADACAAELQIFTEYAPNIAYERNGTVEGFLVPVVREIQRRVGDKSVIRINPWARSLHLSQEEPNVLLFPVSRTKDREGMFQWVGTLNTQEGSFFAKAGSGIVIRSLDDAKRVPSITVPSGFYTDEELTRLGFSNLDRITSIDQMFKKLLAGRTSLIAMEKIAVDGWLKGFGIPEDQVVPVYSFMNTDFELAFSSKTSPDIVSEWRKALADIKSDGTFERLTHTRPSN